MLALISLFVATPRLSGFQCLVPRVFDVYLEKSTTLRTQYAARSSNHGFCSVALVQATTWRAERPILRRRCPCVAQPRGRLCRVLAGGGEMDKTTIERVATDDELVRQPLFWSVAGMSLFSGGEHLRDPKVRRAWGVRGPNGMASRSWQGRRGREGVAGRA